MHEYIEQGLAALLPELTLYISDFFRAQPFRRLPVLGIDVPCDNGQRQLPGNIDQLRIEVAAKTSRP